MCKKKNLYSHFGLSLYDMLIIQFESFENVGMSVLSSRAAFMCTILEIGMRQFLHGLVWSSCRLQLYFHGIKYFDNYESWVQFVISHSGVPLCA